MSSVLIIASVPSITWPSKRWWCRATSSLTMCHPGCPSRSSYPATASRWTCRSRATSKRGCLARGAAMDGSATTVPLGMALAPTFLAERELPHPHADHRVLDPDAVLFPQGRVAGRGPRRDCVDGLIAVFLSIKMATKFIGILPLTRYHRVRPARGDVHDASDVDRPCLGLDLGLVGLTNKIIDQTQYTILVTAVIGSALVPTLIAQTWFQLGIQADRRRSRCPGGRGGSKRGAVIFVSALLLANLVASMSSPTKYVRQSHRSSRRTKSRCTDGPERLGPWPLWPSFAKVRASRWRLSPPWRPKLRSSLWRPRLARTLGWNTQGRGSSSSRASRSWRGEPNYHSSVTTPSLPERQ